MFVGRGGEKAHASSVHDLFKSTSESLTAVKNERKRVTRPVSTRTRYGERERAQARTREPGRRLGQVTCWIRGCAGRNTLTARLNGTHFVRSALTAAVVIDITSWRRERTTPGEKRCLREAHSLVLVASRRRPDGRLAAPRIRSPRPERAVEKRVGGVPGMELRPE